MPRAGKKGIGMCLRSKLHPEADGQTASVEVFDAEGDRSLAKLEGTVTGAVVMVDWVVPEGADVPAKIYFIARCGKHERRSQVIAIDG